jgi:hypothetical protein
MRSGQSKKTATSASTGRFISNDNLSDNAFAGDLKQRRQCYLFDVCLLTSSALCICKGGCRYDGAPPKSPAADAALGLDIFCGIFDRYGSLAEPKSYAIMSYA